LTHDAPGIQYEPLGFANSATVIDKPITLTFGTDNHCPTPSQPLLALAKEGSIAKGEKETSRFD